MPGGYGGQNMRKGTEGIFDAWKRKKSKKLESNALNTDGDSISSYYTCLVIRLDDDGEGAGALPLEERVVNALTGKYRVAYNRTKYSPTTTNHQRGLYALLAAEFDPSEILLIDGVPRGSTVRDLRMIAERILREVKAA